MILMKTWNCYGIVSGSKFLGQVKAKTEKEAMEKADKLEVNYKALLKCFDEHEDVEIAIEPAMKPKKKGIRKP